jgi:hypothetical protein
VIYQYWMIRYVPNVARGEFTNIGLVCGADGGDWAVSVDTRGIRSSGTLRSDLRELSGWTRWFRGRIASHSARSLDDGADVGAAWIEHLRARQANAVQFSQPSPIEAESAEAAIDLLFPHLVERDVKRRARPGITRQGMRAGVREALVYERNLVPGHTLFLQPKARVGRQHGQFDLSRDDAGGTILTNTWAFNVATLDDLERDTQSWNYFVSRFRNDGAKLLLGGQERQLTGEEQVEVVFDRPKNRNDASRRDDIFEAAREAWDIEEVQAVAYSDYLSELHSDVSAAGGSVAHLSNSAVSTQATRWGDSGPTRELGQ